MKTKFVILALPALAFVCAGCGTKSPALERNQQPAGPGQPVVAARVINYTITDWQGASLGRPIPEWVDYISDRNKEALARVPGLGGKEIYIHTDEAADLDLIRANADITAFAQISTQIKAAIATDAGNKLSGDKDTGAKRQYIDTTAGLVSQNVVSGFIRDRDFWQRKQYNDGRQMIEYLAVYAISTDDFKLQLDRALGRVEAKTQEEREAKDAIREAISSAKSLLAE